MQRRHLILVHTEGWQDGNDFYRLAKEVEQRAPDIKTFVVSNTSASHVSRKAAAKEPTLVFSPIRLGRFRPDRGKVYAGAIKSKLEEIQQLAAAGIPIPEFEVLTPSTVLDEHRYGELTILKPTDQLASYGSGVELWRTRNVRFRDVAEFPPSHPGSKGPMIAQRFIDSGFPMTCRVLTFFGEPVFTYLRQSTNRLSLPEQEISFGQERYMPVYPDMTISISKEPDFLDLARRTYEAMPDVALQACDIVREEKTGKVYLLENNPGGGTWMFSNHNAAIYRKMLGIEDLMEPFDALRVCAELLIERTRLEAE